jgi:hypothetical protein
VVLRSPERRARGRTYTQPAGRRAPCRGQGPAWAWTEWSCGNSDWMAWVVALVPAESKDVYGEGEGLCQGRPRRRSAWACHRATWTGENGRRKGQRQTTTKWPWAVLDKPLLQGGIGGERTGQGEAGSAWREVAWRTRTTCSTLGRHPGRRRLRPAGRIQGDGVRGYDYSR